MKHAHAIWLSVAALLAPGMLWGQAPDYSALVSLWRLNGNATDAYGTHNGTVAGTEQYVAGPRTNTQAISLDGNSYVKAGTDFAFDNTTPLSATAWIKGSQNDETIIGKMKQGGGYTGWELHVGSIGTGRLNVWLINTYGSSYIQVNSAPNVLDGAWHHVAFTYDGSSQAAGVKIYVDGQDATGAVAADNLSGTLLNTVNLDIGCRQDGAAHKFKGAIAEASVWASALTPGEVGYLYQNGIHPPVLIEEFSASAALIYAGVPFTLKWNVDPQASVSIDPNVGDVTSLTTNGLGAKSLTIEGPTVFTLTATHNDRTDSRQVSVDLKPLVTALAASRAQIPRGSATLLTWDINPTCDGAVLTPDLAPGMIPLLPLTTNGLGRLVLKPAQTTTYTLRAERKGDFTEAQVTITVTEPAPEAVPDLGGMLGVWLLNGNALDVYGPNDGTFVGKSNYVEGPIPGTQAASLDGASYVRTTPNVALDRTSAFSATAWVKGPLSQDSTILGKMKQGGGYTGWELHVGTTVASGPGLLNVWLINNFGPNYIQVNSPVVVLDDTWHHVAFTYDGSGSAAGVRIYVDGADATGITTADSLTGTLLNTVNFDIGTRQDGANHNFTGAIGEVSLWSMALSPENIAYIYQEGLPLPSLTFSFAADAFSVYAGQTVQLSWQVDPGASVTIDPLVGEVTAKTTNGVGTATAMIEEATTFTLTATLEGRTETRMLSVGLKDMLTSMSLNRTQIPVGGAAVLSWVVSPFVEAIYLDQEPGDLMKYTTNGMGTVVVSPSETTTYMFTVEHGNDLVAAPFTLTVTPAEPVTEIGVDALVSLWPLQGDALDAFGRNPGHWSANPSYVPGPLPGSVGAYFMGTNYIAAGTNINFDANTPFSATAWVNGDAAGNDSTFIGKMQHGGTYTGWELHVGTPTGNPGPAGRPNVWLINSWQGNTIQVNSPTVVLDNSWHFVGFTYDGSSMAAGVKVYVDGEDATGSASLDSLTGTLLNNAELNIGSRQNGTAHLFRGAISEAAVWNATLTPENMRYLYAKGAPKPLRLEQARFAAPATFSFGWNSVVQKTYRIEVAATLDGPWAVLEAAYPIGGATGTLTTYNTASTGPQRFFRVRANP